MQYNMTKKYLVDYKYTHFVYSLYVSFVFYVQFYREVVTVVLYAAAIYWRKLNRDERRYTFVADFGGVFVQM